MMFIPRTSLGSQVQTDIGLTRFGGGSAFWPRHKGAEPTCGCQRTDAKAQAQFYDTLGITLVRPETDQEVPGEALPLEM